MVRSQTQHHVLEALKNVTEFSLWHLSLLSLLTVWSRREIEALIVILEYKIRIVLVGKHVQLSVAGHLMIFLLNLTISIAVPGSFAFCP